MYDFFPFGMEKSSNENVKAVFFSVEQKCLEQKCIEKTQIYKITVQFSLTFFFNNINVNMNMN